MIYEIVEVGAPREWASEKYGSRYNAYPLSLKDSEGKVHLAVEWSRKLDSKAPTIGDKIAGDIQGGQHGNKLKVDYDATKELHGGSTGGGDTRSSTTTRPYQPESQRDPERSARILRQHSQDMSLRYYELLGEKADLGQIFATADQFDRDVIAVGQHQQAAQGAGSVGGTPSSLPSAPPREASPAPAQAPVELEELLEGAGFTPAQTTVVGRYIEDKFDPSQRASAEASLKDPERVRWAKQKLTEGTEHWSGEPLPTTTVEDEDVPF